MACLFHLPIQAFVAAIIKLKARAGIISHPYGYETFILTLAAPHEEVQGRQTKLHPVFTLGKLVQPSPGISFLWDSHIVLSKWS